MIDLKIYKYYKKLSDDIMKASMDLSLEDKYPLYAFTNDKKVREEFKNTRDMNNFIEIVTKVTKEEYKEFGNANSGALLNYYKYESHKGYNDEKNVRMNDIQVLSTWNEKEAVNACLDNNVSSINENVAYDILFPFMFKMEYIKALGKLMYLDIWKYYGSIEKFKEFLTEEELEYVDDYSYPDIKFDELNTFIMLYGNTFK